MLEFEFPYAATGIAGVLAFVLGLFWYHPKVMGTRWMEARGKEGVDPIKLHPKQIVVSLLLWLISASFYSFLIDILDINLVEGFFALSCLLWVAFAMPPILMGALYTGHAFEAASIDASYQLAGYYVFALVHIIFSTMMA